LAGILRSNGFDAVSTPEAGRLSEPDPAQLEWCHEQDRAIVTFNTRDFGALHKEWLVAGKHHSGIIVSDQRPIGDLMHRVRTGLFAPLFRFIRKVRTFSASRWRHGGSRLDFLRHGSDVQWAQGSGLRRRVPPET
jgi:hypothetical protein